MFWGEWMCQERREALKRGTTSKYIKTIIYHSEILTAIFCNQIKSESMVEICATDWWEYLELEKTV